MQRYRGSERPDEVDDERTERLTRIERPTAPTDETNSPPSSDYSHHRSTSEFRVSKAIQVLYYFLGVLEGLLALRLVFRLIGANPQSPISQLIYGISAPFLEPFRGLIQNPSANGQVLEVTTIIAMVIYFLLFIAIAQLLRLFVLNSHG